MSCAKECLKVNSSVCVTENQAYIKDNHEVQLALPSSSCDTVTEESSDLLVSDKHSMVDRSAFIPQKKATQYIDALPKSTSKNCSPRKKTSTAGKQRSSSASELRHKDHQPSPKKVLVSSTDDKHKKSSSSSKPKLKDRIALSAMDKQHDETGMSLLSPNVTAIDILQKSKQTNSSNYKTAESAKNISQMTIQTMDKSSTNNTEATGASSISKSSVSHRSIPSNISVSSVPSNAVYPCGIVNTHTLSSSRHVRFSNDSPYDSNDNRTDKRGGQRKRISHFTNMSIAQQVKRKRHHSDDTGSKKAKLN